MVRGRSTHQPQAQGSKIENLGIWSKLVPALAAVHAAEGGRTAITGNGFDEAATASACKSVRPCCARPEQNIVPISIDVLACKCSFDSPPLLIMKGLMLSVRQWFAMLVREEWREEKPFELWEVDSLSSDGTVSSTPRSSPSALYTWENTVTPASHQILILAQVSAREWISMGESPEREGEDGIPHLGQAHMRFCPSQEAASVSST